MNGRVRFRFAPNSRPSEYGCLALPIRTIADFAVTVDLTVVAGSRTGATNFRGTAYGCRHGSGSTRGGSPAASPSSGLSRRLRCCGDRLLETLHRQPADNATGHDQGVLSALTETMENVWASVLPDVTYALNGPLTVSFSVPDTFGVIPVCHCIVIVIVIDDGEFARVSTTVFWVPATKW